MKVAVQIVHAFDHCGTGGNPAGAVLDADALSPPERQAVAAAAGRSETAFVSRSNAADFRLGFFTPNRQIGVASPKETIDGCRATSESAADRAGRLHGAA